MQFRYFDAHAHTQFSAYDGDRELVLGRAYDAGIGVINVGTQRDTSKKAVDIADPAKGIYAVVGLHPLHANKSFHDEDELGGGEAAKAFTSRGEEFDDEFYKKLASDDRVVAIGECGLDYYRLAGDEAEFKKRQRDAFEKQIMLANEVSKPLMLHVRQNRGVGGGEAFDEVYEMVKSLAKVHIHLHSYTGDWLTAKKFLDVGATFAFTGVLTLTHDYDEVVRNVPTELMMTDTDCPYLAPVPYRGKKNEPLYIKEVVRVIAKIKDEEETRVADLVVKNTRRVFHI